MLKQSFLVTHDEARLSVYAQPCRRCLEKPLWWFPQGRSLCQQPTRNTIKNGKFVEIVRRTKKQNVKVFHASTVQTVDNSILGVRCDPRKSVTRRVLPFRRCRKTDTHNVHSVHTYFHIIHSAGQSAPKIGTCGTPMLSNTK